MEIINPIGVMLIALGGPESLEEVSSFMTAFLERPIPSQLLDAVTARYRLIGGKSPLPALVRAQAEKLGRELGDRFLAMAGFRHGYPSIEKTFAELARIGIPKLIALPMSPYYSTVTTGAYRKALKDAESLSPETEVVFIDSWHDHPSFIKAWTEQLRQDLNHFPCDRQSRVQVIFSAHSIPMKYIQAGDPYQKQIAETVNRIVDCLELKFWHLAYQSKGVRSMESWLGPEVEQVLDEIEAAGFKDVLQVPIGFTCDHLETLYDIEIVHRKYAEQKGLNFHRAESLNVSPIFIKALADIVKAHLQ
ncbi:MAG: ferrochelatase [Candidatus Tectomicrobia bacterium]|uniref:Ferrochelatase n=1 Tax=Tectimicrobiota bacterium TaxID=2528274 RepID=A0A933LQE3_UNCTE|nr:ferrochelatase [Candidatus Tectomicrobia bacterium]